MNKKLCLTLLSLLLMASGCSKESTVADVGPRFSLDSLEVKLNSADANTTPIRRDDLTSGPQIQLKMNDPGSIVSIERKLICGSLTLPGRKVGQNDLALFNFRLATEEFPGLNLLPIQAKCKLVVVATNNIGSTSTKTLPVTLAFDKMPPVEILRTVSTGGLNSHNDRIEIPVEKYSIKNSLPYNLNMTFSPQREVISLIKYRYKADEGASDYKDLYNKDQITLRPSRIEVKGSVLQQFGDMNREVRIVVPPGGTVTLTSYAQVPDSLTIKRHFPDGPGIAPGIRGYFRSFLGVFVIAVRENKPTRSISLSRGMELAPEDLTDPVFLDLREENSLPGIEGDPNWQAKLTSC